MVITSYFVYSFDHKAATCSGQFRINDIIINATVVITPILINIIYIFIFSFFLSFFHQESQTTDVKKNKKEMKKKKKKKKKKHFVIYAIRRPRMKQRLVPPPPHPPTCMHVPFLFLIINFVFITNLQFQNSKTTTCYFIHGYIIMYVYMNMHVHCFMASLDKLLDPPHMCNII